MRELTGKYEVKKAKKEIEITHLGSIREGL